jgi:ABC-type uncharacterized transport system permease subunit
VTGLLFAEDQAGFLAGALAGLVTESGTVGFIGGEDIAPVRKYQRGFKHGLAHTNRRAQVLDTYTESFTDLTAGEEAGTELVMHGADVVFAAAGECGGAAIESAAREGAWVIGVDQDQWRTTFESGQVPSSEKLLTSAVKRVDQAVYVAVTQAVAKGLQSGVMRFNLSNEGVGLAPYHEADVAVPSEVRGKIQEVAGDLRSGRIRTHVGPSGEDLRRGLMTRMTEWNWQAALIPVLAIFSALIIGGIMIAAFDPAVWEAFGEGLGAGLSKAWQSVAQAYKALFEGAFGSPARIIEGFRIYSETGDASELNKGIRPLTESLRISTPYIFAGLAVALGFRCGLFNIGAEGQYFIGGLASVFVGYSLKGVPAIIYLPQFFPNDITIRINAGLFLALAAVAFVYWLLFKTTDGFEIRSVGANPRAARTAGMNVAKNFVLAMALSGGLAGLAGAHDILGVIHFMPNAFFSGYGFDSIALALLGKSHPVGVLWASLLFGFLRAGAQRMQAPPAFVPIDIIQVVQALIIIFIAAPEVIRLIYRLRAPKEEAEAVFTRGWGST